LAKEEGLLVGISSGANVFAAVTVAKTLKKDAVIVTVFVRLAAEILERKFLGRGLNALFAVILKL
jgi:hypothetical protein